MSSFRPSADWQEGVSAIWRRLAEQRLGPAIAGDAKGYCPVLTGALRDSIEHHLDGDVLVIRATGSDERTYAAYLEFGHRVYHPSTGIVGPETVPASPFLRPSIYTVRRL